MLSTLYNYQALLGERDKNDNAITHSSRGLTSPSDDGKSIPRSLFQVLSPPPSKSLLMLVGTSSGCRCAAVAQKSPQQYSGSPNR